MMIVATKVGARPFVMWFLVLYGYGLVYSHLFIMFDKLLLLFIIDYILLSWFLISLNVFYLIVVNLSLIALGLGWSCLPRLILLFFSYFVYGGCIFDAAWCLVFSPSWHFALPGVLGASLSCQICLLASIVFVDIGLFIFFKYDSVVHVILLWIPDRLVLSCVVCLVFRRAATG